MKASILPNYNHKEYAAPKTGYEHTYVATAEGGKVLQCQVFRPGSTCVAVVCVWIKGGGYREGKGTAGGGGYDKESAAIAAALEAAGISLSEPIAGRGSAAVDGALEAVARAAGYRRATHTTV